MSDEIAVLIERLMMASGALADRGHVSSQDNTLYAKAASALRALAQENERLRFAVTNKNEACQELADRICELEAENESKQQTINTHSLTIYDLKQRIRALEAKNDSLIFKYEQADFAAKRLGAKWKANEERIRELAAERDAIRRKTIEECEKAVLFAEIYNYESRAVKAIRALAQTDEGKTETGK